MDKYYIFIVKRVNKPMLETDVISTLEFDAESTRDYVFNNNLKINDNYAALKAHGNLNSECYIDGFEPAEVIANAAKTRLRLVN